MRRVLYMIKKKKKEKGRRELRFVKRKNKTLFLLLRNKNCAVAQVVIAILNVLKYIHIYIFLFYT